MYTIIMKKKDTDKITEIIRLKTYKMMKNLVETLKSTTDSDISVELESDDFDPFPSNMLDKSEPEYFPSLTGKYVIVRNSIRSGDITINEYEVDNEDRYDKLKTIEETSTMKFYARSNLLEKNNRVFQLIHKNGDFNLKVEKSPIKEIEIPNYGTAYTETDDGPVLFANNLRYKPELDYLARYNRNYIAHNFNSWEQSGNEYTLSNNMEHMVKAVRHNYGETYVYLVIDGKVYEPINPVFLNCKNAPAIGEYHD